MIEQSKAPSELYPERELVPEREYQRVTISGEEKCGVATALFFTLLFCLLYKNKMLLTELKWTLQTYINSRGRTKFHTSWGKHEVTATQLRGFLKKIRAERGKKWTFIVKNKYKIFRTAFFTFFHLKYCGFGLLLPPLYCKTVSWERLERCR